MEQIPAGVMTIITIPKVADIQKLKIFFNLIQ